MKTERGEYERDTILVLVSVRIFTQENQEPSMSLRSSKKCHFEKLAIVAIHHPI